MKVVPPGRLWLRSVVPILTMAAAYAVAGWLALWLAIPPGYATAIWPASGLALAGVLMSGSWVWPGIWLGSFLVNIWTAFDSTTRPTMVFGPQVALVADPHGEERRAIEAVRRE